MGLIWTLILHYSIAQQIWDELPDEAPVQLTPKQKLMTWIKAKLPSGLPLNNFTSDWNDGVLLGALVNQFKSRACSLFMLFLNLIIFLNKPYV